MPPGDLASDSLWISCGIALIAVFLGLRQWYERRAREPDLSQADQVYFHRQDLRRALGVAVMLLLAAGLLIGSRIPFKLPGGPNPDFVAMWTGIVTLLLVLMGLALIDLLATRRYAQRKRRAMASERIDLIRDALRKRLDPPDASAENDQDPQ